MIRTTVRKRGIVSRDWELPSGENPLEARFISEDVGNKEFASPDICSEGPLKRVSPELRLGRNTGKSKHRRH
jgi:hypothetical protein